MATVCVESDFVLKVLLKGCFLNQFLIMSNGILHEHAQLGKGDLITSDDCLWVVWSLSFKSDQTVWTYDCSFPRRCGPLSLRSLGGLGDHADIRNPPNQAGTAGLYVTFIFTPFLTLADRGVSGWRDSALWVSNS